MAMPLYCKCIQRNSFFFTVKTVFESAHRFDQCGVVVYLDSENWLKASIEYENQQYQRLGSVVANQGYSDWATTDIDASIREIWYRLSRRGQDFCLECSRDGENFYQMRNCHLAAASGEISLGLYACSPENSLFRAGITQMQVTECLWQGHG